jgi:hypothetical protein
VFIFFLFFVFPDFKRVLIYFIIVSVSHAVSLSIKSFSESLKQSLFDVFVSYPLSN